MIDTLSAFAKYLPEIKRPTTPVPVKERLFWTGVAVFLFFLMYNTSVIGVKESTGQFGFLQVITASRIGSFLTVGIGPIVFASILLQLLKAGGFFELNLQDPKQRVKFHEAQKVLTIVLAVVEASVFVFGGHVPLLSTDGLIVTLVIGQIALGAVLLFYVDEIVSKYGIGSGVSLFIGAGVSFSILSGLVWILVGDQGVVAKLVEGGATAIPSALLALAPFIFTVLIFLGVSYAEGMKVEIPLTHEYGRGVVRQQGFKFFYVSNIPVIFAVALLLNIQLFGGVVGKVLKDSPLSWLAVSDDRGVLRDGLLYLITPLPHTIVVDAHISYLMSTTPVFHIPQLVHALFYLIFLTLSSLFFGKFWAETQGMDAESVASQLSEFGLQVPGYRRDPRLLKKMLKRYIDPLIIVSSVAVGLLAGFADLFGALGTGTGILLSVSIFHNFYEQMQRHNVFNIYPRIAKLFE
jgi:preprotein translocase subunit SecY